MITTHGRNVNLLLQESMKILTHDTAVVRESRNGEVTMADCPVTMVTMRPWERVLFCPERDANPFFHLCEALWMLAGRDDVAFPAFFAKQLNAYSDDGRTLHGAYGHRWRVKFGRDQVDEAIAELARNSDSRRAVIQMWHVYVDTPICAGKDLPCNLVLTVQVNSMGEVELTVFQRSGDALWGVHGANNVHFSMLQEYIAGALGRPVGPMTQVTVNYHAYNAVLNDELKAAVLSDLAGHDLYTLGIALNTPLGVSSANRSKFDEQCRDFCDWKKEEDRLWLPFFLEVALPMRDAYKAYKETPKPEAFSKARLILGVMKSKGDWFQAATQWLNRREEKWHAEHPQSPAAPAAETEEDQPVNTEFINDRTWGDPVLAPMLNMIELENRRKEQPVNMDHLNFIHHVAETDLSEIRRKEATYRGSWKKRGGTGAFMMMARKWDRIEGMLSSTLDWDVLTECARDLSGADGTLLAEVRDLRRYLTLVEAEVIAQSVTPAVEIRCPHCDAVVKEKFQHEEDDHHTGHPFFTCRNAEQRLLDLQHAVTYALPVLEAAAFRLGVAGDVNAYDEMGTMIRGLQAGTEIGRYLPRLQELKSHLAVSKLISAIEATFVEEKDRML